MSACLGVGQYKIQQEEVELNPPKVGISGFKEDLGQRCSGSHLEGNSESRVCGQGHSQPGAPAALDKVEVSRAQGPLSRSAGMN